MVKFTIISGLTLVILCVALSLISPVAGAKLDNFYEKSGPYECGFDPSGSGHLMFSMRYFLIVLIFLIFDVEIALLLPLIVIAISSAFAAWGVTMVMFLTALLFGTLYEWKDGALDWAE